MLCCVVVMCIMYCYRMDEYEQYNSCWDVLPALRYDQYKQLCVWLIPNLLRAKITRLCISRCSHDERKKCSTAAASALY